MPARDLTRWTQNEDGTWRPTVHVKTTEPVETEVEEVIETETDVVSVNGDYSEMSLVELREALIERGLPKTGNKPELIARLQDADA